MVRGRELSEDSLPSFVWTGVGGRPVAFKVQSGEKPPSVFA